MFSRPARIIVPQYEPTPGLSLVACAELLGDSKRAIAAQIVDLAVRKVVTIAREPGRRKRDGFTLVLADASRTADAPTPAGQDERDVLQELFGGALTAGSRLEIAPGRNRGLGIRLREPHRRAVARLIAGGLVRERGWLEKAVVWWRKQPTEPLPRANASIDHLWGVRDYIALAEKERFAFLQAPETALRRPGGAALGELEIVHLHERLLPYAVLFGLEKEWMRELDLRYRDLPPEVLESLGDVLDVAIVVVQGVDLIVSVADLATIVDAGDALDGVGAIFGGIGEVLGSIDFPDIG